MSSQPDIQAFFHEQTNSVTYLVSDPSSNVAVIIDPVLDYDLRDGRIGTTAVNEVLAVAQEKGLSVEWVLETHVHADHLSAAWHIKQRTGAKVGIGRSICEVQEIFRSIFNLHDVSSDGSEFDVLLADGDRIALGGLSIEVMHTPGHTPACVSYLVGDVVFVGDTLFMPDYGVARADFPGGSSRLLFRSIKRLLSLPPTTRMFLCHDYLTSERGEHAWETTVAEQNARNRQAHAGIGEDEFIKMREERDATLPAPELLFAAIQINIRAGRLPPPESNGTSYLKIPVAIED